MYILHLQGVGLKHSEWPEVALYPTIWCDVLPRPEIGTENESNGESKHKFNSEVDLNQEHELQGAIIIPNCNDVGMCYCLPNEVEPQRQV